ncbi:MAG: hypothetical protein ACKONH_03215, partial [Planctomycetia bacterium]
RLHARPGGAVGSQQAGGRLTLSGRQPIASGCPRGSGAAVASAFRCPAPEPTRLDERQESMGEAIARLKQLRNCFERAKKRLDSLPESGLSEAGQPHIQEVAEALQSFAAWFGELTFDHYSLFGSARRVHVALAGFDAIADWVGLHRSQQFAADLSEQMAELVKQSEDLDDTVMAAFLVERTPSRVVYRRDVCVPQEQQDAIEDGIQSVASLAGHLGVRLQRIAVMAVPRPAKADGKQKKRRDRKGIGGRKKKYSEQFVREVLAARRREERACRKSKDRLPPKNEWLRLYCRNRDIDTTTKFPSESEATPEPWDVRANRFWKAAAAQVKRAGN